MLNKPQLGAAILAVSACCPADGWAPLTSQCGEKEHPNAVPTVNISPSGERTAKFVQQEKPVTQRKRKYRVPVPNPVIDTQQKLWNCIFELKPHLMMDCMEPIIDAGNCYNEGINRIIDDNRQIPECSSARDARHHGGEESEIKRALVKEAQCLTVVMETDPDILRPLDDCFDEEFACLREQIRNNSLVCTAEEQEAKYGI